MSADKLFQRAGKDTGNILAPTVERTGGRVDNEIMQNAVCCVSMMMMMTSLCLWLCSAELADQCGSHVKLSSQKTKVCTVMNTGSSLRKNSIERGKIIFVIIVNNNSNSNDNNNKNHNIIFNTVATREERKI